MSWRSVLRAGSTQAGNAARRFGNFVQRFGTELRLGAPARRLLDASCAFNFHRALVGLAAQGADLGIDGWGGCHGCFI